MRKCSPGCACGKHRSNKCPEGCSCAKHTDEARERSRRTAQATWAAVPDPADRRQRMQAAIDKIEKCEPGCTCGWHRGQSYDPAAYSTRHDRVKRERGAAADHTCVECGSSAHEWAQTHGTDGTDTQDYRPMCRACHRAYDGYEKFHAAGSAAGVRDKAWSTRRERYGTSGRRAS